MSHHLMIHEKNNSLQKHIFMMSQTQFGDPNNGFLSSGAFAVVANEFVSVDSFFLIGDQESQKQKLKKIMEFHMRSCQAPPCSHIWRWRSWTETKEAIFASGAYSSSTDTSGVFLSWQEDNIAILLISGWLDYMRSSSDSNPLWSNSSPLEFSLGQLTMVSMHAKTLGAYISGMI